MGTAFAIAMRLIDSRTVLNDRQGLFRPSLQLWFSDRFGSLLITSQSDSMPFEHHVNVQSIEPRGRSPRLIVDNPAELRR